MKIRQPWLIRALGVGGAGLVRLWIRTLRYRYHPVDSDVRPQKVKDGERYIYSFWHENILLLACHYGQPDVLVLISQHADGELIAEICRNLHFGLIRGSTTRGGVEAVRQFLHNGNRAHLAITPDGPRGPRRQVQPGAVYLASRTGLPIVPIGIAFRRAWRMPSWDRFALPRPGSLATCLTLRPLHVPPDLSKHQLEQYRTRFQGLMDRANHLAERWAANDGAWPGDPVEEPAVAASGKISA
jgi:lysophospholipid acyltransferase (LPLAT)-like uncharacterized protein